MFEVRVVYIENESVGVLTVWLGSFAYPNFCTASTVYDTISVGDMKRHLEKNLHVQQPGIVPR